MNKIVKKVMLNPTTTLMEIEAPYVAAKAKAGQFIILRVDEDGERIPLTVAGTDTEKGTVKIIFLNVGATTNKLSMKEEGEYISDFAGPMGKPSEIQGLKKACVVGGGVGCAIALYLAESLHAQGVEVTSIIGFRNKDLVILEDEFAAASDRLVLMTDDGSYGRHGNCTVPLKEMFEAGEQFDMVFAIGPLIMMKFTVLTCKPFNAPITVSMNPIMVDGTGMCGGCRLTLVRDGQRIVKFACVDGPEFNGYEVDFDESMSRGTIYAGHEKHKREESCNLLNGAAKPAKKITMIPKRYAMPVQDPVERAHNFDEVALGYPTQVAIKEANRCLECKNQPCVKACPVNVDIPGFISLVKKGKFEDAYQVIAKSSSLPAVCGRVCPQETQCESKCTMGVKFEPVSIGRLERFVADRHNENVEAATVAPEANGHKVAIVGAGPAGLTCAGDLAKKGYEVTIYEALHAGGGVLRYGIPEFRLPKAIVSQEINAMKSLGVKLETNVVIGKTLTVDELFDMGNKAVFVGSGAGLPSFLGIPGEGLNGVYSANEFLTRTNLMGAYKNNADTPIMKGGKVAVVGGGNVAMDAARTALRLGAEEVHIIYRRSMDELPARKEEVEHAIEEGIEFNLLTNPVEITGFKNPENPRDPMNGFVTGIRCVRMELGEPDEKGRRRPVEIPGSEFEMEVSTVIIAVGTTPNPLIKSTTEGLQVNAKGGIIVDEAGLSSREGVYAGGDAVTGAATVISAMGAGKVAAKAIDEWIMSK